MTLGRIGCRSHDRGGCFRSGRSARLLGLEERPHRWVPTTAPKPVFALCLLDCRSAATKISAKV
jgi:hypothetical protein